MATISFYFDEMMSRRVADQLKEQGITVVMAVDEGMVDKDDIRDHLPFATQRSLVLVTQDRPFAGRVMQIADHAGVICWTGTLNDIGGMVTALTDFATQYEAENVAGNIFWLK